VRLLRSQVAVAEVAGPTASLRAAFLHTGEAAPPLESALAVTVRPGAQRAEWLEPGVRRWTAFRPRVGIGPGLAMLIATEVSALEYVASVRPEVVLPLWPGATGYARWDLPIAVSSRYRSPGDLQPNRPDPVLLEALLYQALPVGPGLTALAGGGVIESSAAGGLGELLWTSAGGFHALGLQGAATRDVFTAERRTSVTGSYRSRLPWLDAVAEVRAGRFLAGDRGWAARLSRFFGHTRVGLFLQSTDHSVAGIDLTLPLTPRREMRPGLFQVRGDNRFSQAVGTVVGERHNPLVAGAASPPLTRFNLQDVYLDRGRLDREALVASLPRAPAAFLPRADGAPEGGCVDGGAGW
jgi:hypothetical protein